MYRRVTNGPGLLNDFIESQDMKQMTILVGDMWRLDDFRLVGIGHYQSKMEVEAHSRAIRRFFLDKIKSCPKKDEDGDEETVIANKDEEDDDDDDDDDDDGEKEKEKEDEETIRRVRIEFLVTTRGADEVCASRLNGYDDNNNPMVSFISGGCDGGRVTRECQWVLDASDDSDDFITRLNRAMSIGWIVISRIVPDPSAAEFHFICTSDHPMMGILDYGRLDWHDGTDGWPICWSLDQYCQEFWKLSSDTSTDHVKDVNQAWSSGKIRLSSVALQTRKSNKVQILPSSGVKVEHMSAKFQFPETARTVEAPVAKNSPTLPPQAVTRESVKEMAVSSVKTDAPFTTTPIAQTPVIVHPPVKTEVKMTRSMHMIVSSAVSSQSTNKILQAGCDGKTNVWTLERAIENLARCSSAEISAWFYEAVQSKCLQLVDVPPRIRVGDKGYVYLQCDKLMYGPLHYFVQLCSTSGNLSKEFLEQRIVDVASEQSTFAMSMYGQVFAHYEEYVKLAIQQEFIVPF